MKFNPFKPLIKVTGKGMTGIFLIAGIVMIALGVYFGFFQGKGYEETTAVVTDLREEYVGDSTTPSYFPTVRYTVGGKEYTADLGSSVNKNKLGTEIKIKYDPTNPAKAIENAPGIAIYLLIAGALITVFAVYSFVTNKKKNEELAESRPTELFGAPQPGLEERKLYFVTDLGTAKGTCHIEDANRTVLYEAVSTKFSLIADSEMEFVDHMLGRRTAHMVGKTVTSSSNGFFVLDNHSTFDFDGRDIWKQLHENGIRIATGLNGLKWAYTIYRDDVEIAQAINTNKLVHEEDAEAKGIIAKVPFPGFFRITTKEQNLDAIFLTLFAIGRTDMMFYD
ncbi:MAG: DUF3592 domain-containing protein [Firmicutes bacterium]|nr:DUF3592 domain-containing protein [Bacillota bacterium]